MFALPKWLTDIKTLFGAADGKLLGRAAGEWEFVDPPVIPTTLADLAGDATHRTVTDVEIADWDGKQAALGYTPENAANKDTDGTMAANSDAKYPSQKAVKSYVDAHAGGGSAPPVTKIYTQANYGGF